MLPVPRAELPLTPKDPERWYKVIRPQSNQRLSFIALNDSLYQCFVHWDETIRRNRPCFGPEVCQRCGPNSVRIWQGYLSGVSRDLKTRSIYEITMGCARAMHAQGLLSQSLYGVELVLWRKPTSGTKNGPVMLVEHGQFRATRMPARLDPLKSLLRLWSWNDEHENLIRAKMEAAQEQARQEFRRTCERAST